MKRKGPRTANRPGPGDAADALLSVAMDILETLERIRPEAVSSLAHQIVKARQVFLTGQGRTGAVARAAAIRLGHLRPGVHFVGDATAPPIGRGDLLIACSGRGTTAVSCLHAQTAKRAGARLAAVTAAPRSRLARMSDPVLVIPAVSGRPRQLGGSRFEQSLLVLLDAAALLVARRDRVGERTLQHRHTNLQ